MRYAALIDAVRQKKPTAILEIGTWNGQRAEEMLRMVPDAKYYGFDLFETATAETDSEEMNVKPHYTLDRVYERLHGYNVQLFKGNTRETLPLFNEPVDFVWLDGGHSVETIRSDWENVKRVATPDAWIFMDDFYTGPIDTKKFGCNEILKDVTRFEILPHRDYVAGGGWVQMVRVYP